MNFQLSGLNVQEKNTYEIMKLIAPIYTDFLTTNEFEFCGRYL